MTIFTIGIDLAKNVFDVHTVDESGKPAPVRPNVSRDALIQLIATPPKRLIGMAACSGGITTPEIESKEVLHKVR